MHARTNMFTPTLSASIPNQILSLRLSKGGLLSVIIKNQIMSLRLSTFLNGGGELISVSCVRPFFGNIQLSITGFLFYTYCNGYIRHL